jgi:hypothetical protein
MVARIDTKITTQSKERLIGPWRNVGRIPSWKKENGGTSTDLWRFVGHPDRSLFVEKKLMGNPTVFLVFVEAKV